MKNGQLTTFSSLPFGDNPNSGGANVNEDSYHFAGLDDELSSSSGVKHAIFREYSSTLGRWNAPDAYGGSYDTANPQSFNRYSYVQNNPLGFLDPLGLYFVCNLQSYSVSVGEDVSTEYVTSCFDIGGGGGGDGGGLIYGGSDGGGSGGGRRCGCRCRSTK